MAKYNLHRTEVQTPAFRKLWLAVCIILITCCSAVRAYYYVFSSFASWDDEGMMMTLIRRLIDGQRLYDDVQSIYGPFYFLYEYGAHVLTGVPVSHDSIRFVSILFWIICGLLLFLLVYRATGSLLLATGVHFLGFRILQLMGGSESAHPQELCILLLLGVAFVACYLADPIFLMASLGALTGAMVATKINLGVYIAVAVVVALAYGFRAVWWRRAACIVVSTGAVLLPVPLMSAHLSEPWAMKYGAVEMLSLAAVILVVSRTKIGVVLGVRHLALTGFFFSISIAVIASFFLAHGSSISAMIHAVIVRPRTSFGHSWFFPARFSNLAVPWALIGLAFAFYATTARANTALLTLLKLIFAAGVAILSAGVATYAGAATYQDAILSFATPFLWLLAVSPRDANTRSLSSLNRAILALVAVIQVLYAYPVAGAQVQFSVILILAVASICFADTLPSIVAAFSRWRAPTVFRMTPAALGLIMGVMYVVYAWTAFQRYQTLEALNFPGAHRLRLESSTAVAFRELVSRAQTSCTTLVTAPGMLSFYFWTGMPVPSLLDYETWILDLNDAEQADVADDLSRLSGVCIIYNQDRVNMWASGKDISSKPMMRFIKEDFRTTFTAGEYKFMVRR
jgi:hypothetical protein